MARKRPDMVDNTTVIALQLQAMFALSKAESTISAHYAHGNTAQEIANQTGYTLSSVRTHIRNAFTKLAISRQNQLAALVKRVLLR